VIPRDDASETCVAALAEDDRCGARGPIDLVADVTDGTTDRATVGETEVMRLA
jgi:hypothetical protein